MDGPPWWWKVLLISGFCEPHYSLNFKECVGSPWSNNDRVLRLDLTSEICPPLHHSSCLHLDLMALVLSGILNGIHQLEMLLKLYGPSIIWSMLRCLRSFDLPELIFCLPIGYKLHVLMPYSLLYFPSMTSIHCLLNIFHSLSIKYLPTYAHVPRENMNKLDNKIEKCIFIGYKDGIKGYKLWNW